MSARRPWAWPLVPLYAAGLAAKDGLRAAGFLKTQRLTWPVISVGSLSAGGAGKTPVVIALANLLHQRGWTVDVLSRGYGREGKGVERVFPVKNAASRFGDEPVLIARGLGQIRQEVWVGADRFEAGKAAEAASKTQIRCVHLMDDGFQHRKLARSVDVILITEEDVHDLLLPAGNLREPLKSIGRGDVVMMREDERERIEKQIRPYMRADAVFASYRRGWFFPGPLGGQTAGARPVAFCGIARPKGFRELLAQAGCSVIQTVEFRDHYPYNMHDMERLVTIAQRTQATGFVTTEKDWTRLTESMRARLAEAGPIALLKLTTKFSDADALMRDIEVRLK